MISNRESTWARVYTLLEVGSFGSVVLVKRKHVKSDRLFAMKIIDKSQIREKNLLQTDLI